MMSYTEIILDLDLRRQNAHDVLKRLKQRGFVHEDGGADWKPGKKKFYSLTDKGRKHLAYSSASETEKALALLRETLNSLDPVKTPRCFEELRAFIDAKEIENFEKILNKLRKEGELLASTGDEK